MTTARGQSNIPLLRVPVSRSVDGQAKSDEQDLSTEVSFPSANVAQSPHDTDNLTDSDTNNIIDSELCARDSDTAVPEMTSEDTGVPYDRGWAWMVVLGSFLNLGLAIGYMQSHGIFFVELLDYFQSTTSHTALLFAIKGVTYSIAGLLVMNVVVGRLGCRKTALIGALLLSLSSIFASVASQLTLLIFLQAALLGLGDVMLIAPGEVLTASYFKRHRSLALAIAKCGASVGGMTIPVLVTYLLSQYGLRGTLLLTGALCLHSLPASLLFRPISYFRSSNRTSQVRTRINVGEKNAELICLETEVDVSVDSLQQVTARNKRSPAIHESAKHEEYELSLSQSREGCAKIRGPLQCTEKEKESDTDKGKLTPEVIEEGSFQNENCDVSLSSHDDASYSKCMDADTETPLLCDNKPTVINVKSSAGSADRQQKLKDGVQAKQTFDSNNALESKTLESGPTAVVTRPRCIQSPLDFSLFRRPVFRLLFSCFILFPTINIAVAYLPVVAREKDVSETDVAKLLSIIGGLDLFSRLGSGIIADRKVVRVSTMVVISFVALGVTYHCVRFLTSFSSFVALAVMQGLLGSVVNCMIPVLIVDHVGLENMAKGIGFYQVAAGSFIAGIHPLLGYIRDLTGSSVPVYHVMGSCALLAAFLLCFAEPCRRLETRPRKSQQHTVSNIAAKDRP